MIWKLWGIIFRTKYTHVSAIKTAICNKQAKYVIDYNETPLPTWKMSWKSSMAHKNIWYFKFTYNIRFHCLKSTLPASEKSHFKENVAIAKCVSELYMIFNLLSLNRFNVHSRKLRLLSSGLKSEGSKWSKFCFMITKIYFYPTQHFLLSLMLKQNKLIFQLNRLWCTIAY